MVAFRETTALWKAGKVQLGVDCNPGQNRPIASDGVVYQACHVDGMGNSTGGMVAMDAATGACLTALLAQRLLARLHAPPAAASTNFPRAS